MNISESQADAKFDRANDFGYRLRYERGHHESVINSLVHSWCIAGA